MHRTFETTDSPFQPRSNLGLYLFTSLLLLLLGADLWPLLAKWLTDQGAPTPTWASREIYGLRYALLAAVLGGARALYSSLEMLSEGRVGADLAIAIACIAAILLGEPLVAAEVVVIGLIGECLEAFTFDRTQRALTSLDTLFPQRCWVLRDGQEVRTLTADVQIGDLVRIKPGGKIPVDGIVREGSAAVDASALTGESQPIEKSPGDAVLAGSLIPQGSLTVEATKVKRETVAGQMIELTAKALKTKSVRERQADQLARYFLPAVLLLALLTFLLNVGFQQWGIPADGKKLPFAAMARVAMYPTLAVLVVACPCPLVLATPAAVIAALGRLAGTGILIKSGAALERLAQVTAFAFDKTGTLTEGKLELGEVRTAEGITSDELLRYAASAEAKSEHPIAAAMLHEAKLRNLTVPEALEFQSFPGHGIAVIIDGSPVVVGNRKLMEERGIAISPEVEAWLIDFDKLGQTALLVAKNSAVLGAIGTRDRVRPEAAGVLVELQSLGIAPILLLSGDRAGVANAVAANLPLAEVHAELLPAQKAERIANLNIAFVGDGANDAPALAAAKVGIAIGTGTDIAAEAGDVVMMGEPLRPLPLLLRLSRETAKVIRQNILWFGFCVNIVGVLLTGFIWPIFASSPDWFEKAPLAGVLYHQIGSIAVLLNSMRLLGFERTSARADSLRQHYLAFDRWMNTIHLDDFIHAIGHHWKRILGGIFVLALLAWTASGLTQIEASEVGVVQRFGAVRSDLTPGLHVRWPWPIETVLRAKPAEVRTVELGFRSITDEKRRELDSARAEQMKLKLPGQKGNDAGSTWGSAHAEGTARLTDESLMLTGDGDLIEVLATVRYTVNDPRRYLLAVREPDAAIRSALEAALRELIAARPFQQLLASGRAEFERAAEAKLSARLKEAAPEGLGIRLEGLTIHDLHPPQSVVAEYHAVAEAIQKRDKVVNEATAEATRIQTRSKEVALRMVRTAEAEAHSKVTEATAARDGILYWQTARNSLPAAVEAELQKLPPEEANTKRQAMIAQRKLLTEFRLSLDAITAVLRSRDKILIDADKLPGTRKLYLLDPDLLPKVPPLVAPREQ
jgi:Cu+-exporting ATPase